MSTGDPRRKPVEPTGNPRVDALIDAMICPTCRTILNAKKAGCADLWHSDNRPEPVGSTPVSEEPARLRPKDLTNEQAAVINEVLGAVSEYGNLCSDYATSDGDDEVTEQWKAVGDLILALYARGISEGRRQAAEALHKAAEGRRVYAATPHALSGLLEAEAGLLDLAADAAGGDLKPLYGWLPSWQWTDEMHAALDAGEPAEQPEGGAR